MNWRRWNYALHRDIGHLCIGLTLIYAVSGIVVNHISHSFNPSYTIEKAEGRVSPLPPKRSPDMDYVALVLRELNETGTFKNVAMTTPGDLRIFVEGNTIDVQLKTGRVQMEKVTRRPLLYEVNFLHLNKAKGVWTWLADLYGLALILLALTGLLMIRGKRRNRALLLTTAGIALPLVYLAFI
jgi:hypothetical protein